MIFLIFFKSLSPLIHLYYFSMENKSFTNLQIAKLLKDVAAAYQVKDADKHRFEILAYQRAADSVEHATSEIKDLWEQGKLEDVPGIGPGIAGSLGEVFKNGRSEHFDEIMKGIPPEAFKLMELPGIGIKTAMKLIKENPEEVQAKLSEVEAREKREKRYLLPYAEKIAEVLINYMSRHPAVQRVDPLGSLRRKAATIGDIDLSTATDNAPEVLEYFTKYPKSQKTLEKGDRAASIQLPGEIRVDMKAQPVDSYGSLLQHFTGSKNHNISLREYSLKKGYSLSEYGIKKNKQNDQEIKKFRTEKEFYNFLGLDFIEPELREDRGEIEAARRRKLPKLVELTDIKCDLQIHSDFDIETSHDNGESSMNELVEKGNQLHYQYLAFTEHNPSQKGHEEKDIVEILKRKREKVDQLNSSLQRGSSGHEGVKKVFNSLEIDMLKDGNLPVPQEGLELLDFALVSVHTSFDLPRKEMTKRVLTGLAHPRVKIFSHPTARLLNEREGIELDWEQIFDFCLRKKKWIEINADPSRLDLPDDLVREAVKLGIMLTLGTDAHHKDGMDNMIYGVSVARRGWAEKKNIINCLTLNDFGKALSLN